MQRDSRPALPRREPAASAPAIHTSEYQCGRRQIADRLAAIAAMYRHLTQSPDVEHTAPAAPDRKYIRPILPPILDRARPEHRTTNQNSPSDTAVSTSPRTSGKQAATISNDPSDFRRCCR